MELFSIVTHPAASLRVRSQEIDPAEVTTPAFQAYLDQLTETMHVKDGIGIASPQVGRNIRAVVCVLDGEAICLINPVITKASEARIESEEGCLSVPGVYGMVERHKRITVEALNRHGRRIELDLRNFSAIVVQHEIDHLDGILFIDKMEQPAAAAAKQI